jgi:hypothetical protein
MLAHEIRFLIISFNETHGIVDYCCLTDNDNATVSDVPQAAKSEFRVGELLQVPRHSEKCYEGMAVTRGVKPGHVVSHKMSDSFSIKAIVVDGSSR